MDLSQALLPGLLVFAIVAGIDAAMGHDLKSAIKVPLSFLLGIAFVFVVSLSDFGHDQLVQNRPLDLLNGWSLLIVGLLVGAAAVGIDQAIKVGKNIGQNQP